MINKWEIEGAIKGLDSMLQAIDKVSKSAKARLEKAQAKATPDTVLLASLRAEVAQIEQTAGQWRYIVKGRRDDLEIARSSINGQEGPKDEQAAEKAAEVPGSDQGQP